MSLRTDQGVVVNVVRDVENGRNIAVFEKNNRYLSFPIPNNTGSVNMEVFLVAVLQSTEKLNDPASTD